MAPRRPCWSRAPGRSDGRPTAILAPVPGEVPERLNGHDWKSCVGFTVHRGFESLPLRWVGSVPAGEEPADLGGPLQLRQVEELELGGTLDRAAQMLGRQHGREVGD